MSLSEKLNAVVADVKAFQEANPATQGWLVYTQGPSADELTGISASPAAGNQDRFMPPELSGAVERACNKHGVDKATCFRVRSNSEHEAAARR